MLGETARGVCRDARVERAVVTPQNVGVVHTFSLSRTAGVDLSLYSAKGVFIPICYGNILPHSCSFVNQNVVATSAFYFAKTFS